MNAEVLHKGYNFLKQTEWPEGLCNTLKILVTFLSNNLVISAGWSQSRQVSWHYIKSHSRLVQKLAAEVFPKNFLDHFCRLV